MRYYPVFLDIAGKPVVVIGGGNIALQKIEGLVDAGADVTVISPDVLPDIQGYFDAGKAMHIAREWRPGDLSGFVLVFVATDDRSTNAVITQEGREKGIWVNAVDDVPNCDFIMPGIVRKGDITLAISTAGKSPAMARKLREDITEFLSDVDAAVLELAAEVRTELRGANRVVPHCERCGRTSNDVWNIALDAEVKKMVSEGNVAGAKERMLRMLMAPEVHA